MPWILHSVEKSYYQYYDFSGFGICNASIVMFLRYFDLFPFSSFFDCDSLINVRLLIIAMLLYCFILLFLLGVVNLLMFLIF